MCFSLFQAVQLKNIATKIMLFVCTMNMSSYNLIRLKPEITEIKGQSADFDASYVIDISTTL